jgi:hypothetical protein
MRELKQLLSLDRYHESQFVWKVLEDEFCICPYLIYWSPDSDEILGNPVCSNVDRIDHF